MLTFADRPEVPAAQTLLSKTSFPNKGHVCRNLDTSYVFAYFCRKRFVPNVSQRWLGASGTIPHQFWTIVDISGPTPPKHIPIMDHVQLIRQCLDMLRDGLTKRLETCCKPCLVCMLPQILVLEELLVHRSNSIGKQRGNKSAIVASK